MSEPLTSRTVEAEVVEIPVYAAVCSKCATVCDYDEFCGYNDKSIAVDIALESGWSRDAEGRLRCENCTEPMDDE